MMASKCEQADVVLLHERYMELPSLSSSDH